MTNFNYIALVPVAFVLDMAPVPDLQLNDQPIRRCSEDFFLSSLSSINVVAAKTQFIKAFINKVISGITK